MSRSFNGHSKSLLVGWSVKSRDKLEEAIQAEMARTVGKQLSLEEQQLLNAARDRLLSWRTPSRTTGNRKENLMMPDNTDAAPKTEPDSPEPKKKSGGGKT